MKMVYLGRIGLECNNVVKYLGSWKTVIVTVLKEPTM